MKIYSKKTLIVAFLLAVALPIGAQDSLVEIPMEGNTYLFGKKGDRLPSLHRESARPGLSAYMDAERGIVFRKGQDAEAHCYVFLHGGESVVLYASASGTGSLECSSSALQKKTKLRKAAHKRIRLGRLSTDRDGYVELSFRASCPKEDLTLHHIQVEGAQQEPLYIKPDFEPYWALRGPSCHLGYRIDPAWGEIEWASAEITVPEEGAIEDSYYMALGFGGGYFGIQRNGPRRRCVLFSVWNAMDGDNNNDIPEDSRVRMIDKGEHVRVQAFGHEGSGQQSILDFPWKNGRTYRFFLHAQPSDEGYVDYSAYLVDTETEACTYMSTLRRPRTQQYLSGLHSFIENFNPEHGDQTRKAYYHDVWVKPKDGDWKPVTEARLTNDNTGKNGIRLDFYGGTENGKFFLQNGGYFDRPLEIERNLKLDAAPRRKPVLPLTNQR